MQTVRRFVTLLLAGVLALTPVVQPIAVYAEALCIGVDDEGDSTSTSSVGQQGAAESDSATASPDHSSTGSVEALILRRFRFPNLETSLPAMSPWRSLGVLKTASPL